MLEPGACCESEEARWGRRDLLAASVVYGGGVSGDVKHDAGVHAWNGGAIAVLGAGRLGQALISTLVDHNLPVALWWARRKDEAPAPMGCTDARGATIRSVAGALVRCETVIVVVSDEAVPLVGAMVAPHLRAGAVVLHTSGASPAAALGDLGSDVHRGAFHPLQTFSALGAPAVDEPYAIGLEGDDVAVERGRALAEALGHPAYVLNTDEKARWHAAAVLAANGLVALQATATRVMEGAGLDAASAWAALRPLVRGALSNLQGGDPRRALTGPVVRGDATTIGRNLSALADDPEASRLYVDLAAAALELSALSEERRGAIQRLLDDALKTPAPAATTRRRSPR